MEDRELRRAGLDYHELTSVSVHVDFESCVASLGGLQRAFAYSAFGETRAFDVRHAAGDVLVFGPESRGLPTEILATFDPCRRLRLPMVAGNRGLNLSNSVAVAVFEAWRQTGFEGAS